jgi:hypothetical protein
MIKRGGKRVNNKGQVTIFIIVAILIVVAAVLVYFLYPKIKTTTSSSSSSGFIQSCMGDELKEVAETISLQGGDFKPELYSSYNNNEISYLCYTNEYYKKCVVQEPLLKDSMEKEIKNAINEKVTSCFDTLEKDSKSKGYEVSLERKDYNIEIQPKKIVLTIDYPLILSKGSSNKYEEFQVTTESNLYNLILIANRIVEWEVQYGDADITSYMNYYSWLKAEKIRKTDGAKIYILTDRDSKDKFQFASRSMVVAPGYSQ